MPTAPPIFNQRPRSREHEKNRPPSSERGYDSRWRKVRDRYWRQHPYCQDCAERGKTEPAIDVHHIIPISQDPDIRLDASNLRSLCRKCHAIRDKGK